MNDYDIIMAFKNMKSIGKICEELKINYANLVQGKCAKDKEHKVVQELKLELYKLNLFMGEK